MNVPAKQLKGNKIQCNVCGEIIDVRGKEEVNCPRCGKYHFKPQAHTKFSFFTAVVWVTLVGVLTFIVYYFVEWLKGLF